MTYEAAFAECSFTPTRHTTVLRKNKYNRKKLFVIYTKPIDLLQRPILHLFLESLKSPLKPLA